MKCVAMCESLAIQLEGNKVTHNSEHCTGCMQCVASCPSNAFKWKSHWHWNLLKILVDRPFPVVTCSRKTSSDGHPAVPCLGILSETFILAAVFSVSEPISLDISSCLNCENRHIVPVLEKKINEIEKRTSIRLSNRIRLVSNPSEIEKRKSRVGRRKFFGNLKSLVKAKSKVTIGRELFSPVTAHKDLYKKDKTVGTRLLCHALNLSDRQSRIKMLETFFFSLKVNTQCKLCGGCAGMCPTGAIKLKRNNAGKFLMFNVLDCNGCGLCRDFCRNHAISMEHGITLKSPLILTLNNKAHTSDVLPN